MLGLGLNSTLYCVFDEIETNGSTIPALWIVNENIMRKKTFVNSTKLQKKKKVSCSQNRPWDVFARNDILTKAACICSNCVRRKRKG